jgi:hypothetical protein
MAHWSHASVAQEAWQYLDAAIGSDIALVQESAPPTERQADCCVWREIGGTRPWGSGVLTKNLPTTELLLAQNSYPGALTVVDVVLPNGSSVVAVSMYGLLDGYGYAITTLHRMLSDLTHLFDGKLRPGGRPQVLLGGDLNASPQFDDIYGIKTHRIFFQRLEAFGLVDCQGTFSDQRPRTLRHPKSNVPWVNDYIFATKHLAQKAVAHDVVERPEMLHLSDHNPVVVTFEL